MKKFWAARICFAIAALALSAKLFSASDAYLPTQLIIHGKWLGGITSVGFLVGMLFWVSAEAKKLKPQTRPRASDEEIKKRDFLIKQLAELSKEGHSLDHLSSIASMSARFTFRGKVEGFLTRYFTKTEVDSFRERGTPALDEMIKSVLDGNPLSFLDKPAANPTDEEPNIVCLGTADINVELDRHEIFRLSNNSLSLRALAIKVVNQSHPPGKVGSAERLGASVVCDSVHFPKLFEIDHVCWLDHERPFITAERDVPYFIILGVIEPKSLGGFQTRATFYENYLNERIPLERKTCDLPIRFKFTVNLRAGAHGQFGSKCEFEFVMDSDQTYQFRQI
jgi:hypothetical protein